MAGCHLTFGRFPYFSSNVITSINAFRAFAVIIRLYWCVPQLEAYDTCRQNRREPQPYIRCTPR